VGYCLSLGIMLSVAVSSAPAESNPAGVQPTGPRTVDVSPTTMLAQRGLNLGDLFRNRSPNRGGWSTGGVGGHSGGPGHSGDSEHSGHGPPSGGFHPPPSGGFHPPSSGGFHPPHGPGHSSGGHSPILPIPIPIPIRPPYRPGPVYPNYPTYPTPSTTVVPSNTVPAQPEEPVEPEPNVVVVEPESNAFIDKLNFKVITAKELGAFKDQITKKTDQLGDELKALFPGNEQAIDELVALAHSGKLNPAALQQAVAALGANLALQQQLQATKLLKQLAFNNMAMAALLAVNINNLNININLININVNVNLMGGGVWIGYWGFPWWPWDYPLWLGPGMWWGPCAYCPYPYYNPQLTGADALGVPYGIADPIPNYDGEIIESGILLKNAGGSAVNYTVDGQKFSMEPEYRQVIPRERIVVAFNRGGSYGNARYGISEGTYKFTPTDRGWELYKHTSKVTINNADNPFPFKYVLNNERQTLPAGSQTEHTGKYPLVFQFDSGQGQVRQKMVEQGVYVVAVGGDGGLDLFRPEEVSMPAPIAEMSKKLDAETQNIFAEPDKIPNLFGDTTASTTTATQPSGTPPNVPSLFGNETR